MAWHVVHRHFWQFWPSRFVKSICHPRGFPTYAVLSDVIPQVDLATFMTKYFQGEILFLLKGSFNDYMDQLLTSFDHHLPKVEKRGHLANYTYLILST